MTTNISTLSSINSIITNLNRQGLVDRMDISDGHHTFRELYDFRMIYNALLFNEWAKQGLYDVHKSRRHHDGEECFGGGWFIVVAVLPTGQISNHYPEEDWAYFDVPFFEKAKYDYDGHTPNDVLSRLLALIEGQRYV